MATTHASRRAPQARLDVLDGTFVSARPTNRHAPMLAMPASRTGEGEHVVRVRHDDRSW